MFIAAVVLHARKEIKTMKILLAKRKTEENANPKIAHLQFAQANAQKDYRIKGLINDRK